MNWEAIGAVGEIIGAVGVIVTLGYLAYQIRQNTTQLEQNTVAAKAAAQNASNVALRDTRKSIFESGEMAEILQIGNANPNDLSAVSLLRYRLLMQNVTEVMLEIYTQTQVTSLSPETWATQGITLVERVFVTPGGQWFWGEYAHNYPSDFQAEINRIIKNSSAVSIDAQ